MIVNTMNIIKEHNWLGAQLALAGVIIDDMWHHNLECHLLDTLEAAFTIAIFYNTGPRSKLKLPIFLLQLLSKTRQLGQANVPSLPTFLLQPLAKLTLTTRDAVSSINQSI